VRTVPMGQGKKAGSTGEEGQSNGRKEKKKKKKKGMSSESCGSSSPNNLKTDLGRDHHELP
jgi:ribosome assembly protein YihI (activator of Der GTPase)